ncbi:glycosyltransferase family 2 protein [Kineococcus gynurae]|uniref:Glycosyltransferase family 2 protein n=1 Tax=Kineococcus gynurae TaxID=452979 RepID=A0ABV5LWV7_9ACTN
MTVELSVIIVTYNAPEWVERCLTHLTGPGAPSVAYEIVVVDNASGPQTRDLLQRWAEREPRLRLHLSAENLGFGRGCNLAVARSTGRTVVLLNPDAEALPGTLDALLAFHDADPRRGLVGGRVLDPQGVVQPESCWGAPTLWSWFCSAVFLTAAFPRHPLFDPESLGRWARDSVREVDIITGCLLLTARTTWDELGGFDESFFMYGEDADLGRRAADAGYHPSITPAATIVHAGGASSANRTAKQRLLLRGKATYARKHWAPRRAAIGVGLLQTGVALRTVAERVLRRGTVWAPLWAERRDWAAGWATSPDRAADLRGTRSGSSV